MEYWILRDAGRLESQLWHIASAFSAHWPQNTLLKVQSAQTKFTAFVQAVFFQAWPQNCLLKVKTKGRIKVKGSINRFE